MAGGSQVTITGSNFGADSAVTIRGETAAIVQIPNQQTIICTAPASMNGTGAVDVSVEVLGMTATLEDGFLYAGSGNSDGDPDPDLVEIYTGQDPFVTEGRQALEPLSTGTQATLRFHRKKVTPLTGTIRWSKDLKTWREDSVSLTVIEDQGDIELVEVTIPRSGNENIFVILEVQ